MGRRRIPIRRYGQFSYRQSAFDGTVSVWLRDDPDAGLASEFPVDPFHISRHPADGSFYLDLTRLNDWRYGCPRKLRFGIYGDSQAQDMFVGGQLIFVGDLGRIDQQWHHIAATWRNANSGREDAAGALYVDGVLRGWMEGYEHRLSWDIDQMTIGLGPRYVGEMDELLILDVALSPEQIAAMQGLGRPVGDLLRFI